MLNIPLRPAGVNFWGAFLTLYGAGATVASAYGGWDFDAQYKPQIDAIKAKGGNSICHFGGPTHGLTTNQYLACWKELLDYCLARKMYVFPYANDTPGQWDGISTATTAALLETLCQLFSKYPNIPLVVTVDEPIFSGNVDAPKLAIISTLYAAAKANLPSDIPVCGCPNPASNEAVPVFAYTGDAQTNTDGVAPYCEILVYHPFNAATLSESSAVRAAYPDKEIALLSTMNSSEGAGDIATKCAATWGLVGANKIRAACWFTSLDYPTPAPANTVGLFNDDLTDRTTKTTAFTTNIDTPVAPVRQRRRFADCPRLNQRLDWNYAA